MVRLGTLWLAIALGWAPVANAAPAADAQDGDYRTDNTTWNGLSILASLAESSGLTVMPTNEIDWNDIAPTDVLVLLYPRARIEPTHVAGFLRTGGRLLLADDFGQADEALAELRVLSGPLLPGATLYQENPGLPIAKASHPDHPLAQGVDALVFNHPSAFSVAPGPDRIFGFGQGQDAVVAGTLGLGRFVVLSDPSVLINGMLAFDGNAAFAANLMTFLAPRDLLAGAGRLLVLTHDFQLLGTPRSTLDTTRGFASANQLLQDFGSFLSELNDYLAPQHALRWAEALIGVGLMAALLVLPRRKRKEYDGTFARAQPASDVQDPHALAAWYDENRMANYAPVAALLRDGFEARLATLFPDVDPRGPAPPLADRCEEAFGPAARRALVALLHQLRALPVSEVGFASRRDFERACAAVRALEQRFMLDRTDDGRPRH